MLAYLEKEIPVSILCAENSPAINCLSWTKADTNDDLREGGWLATGNSNGGIGVTYTSTVHHSNKAEIKKATTKSYNLQSLHQSKIIFVKFNKQVDTLASCDKRGIVCVWRFLSTRWICTCECNAFGNENVGVTDIIWGRKGWWLVICHPGGVVSVLWPQTGRNASYPVGFGTPCNHLHATISPCDRFIYVGTEQGEIRIIDLAGMNTYPVWHTECGIIQVCCSRNHTLAVGLLHGTVTLLGKEPFNKELITNLESYCLEWSESSKYLAVLGVKEQKTLLKFYNEAGVLLVNLTVPESIKACTQKTLAITWGHKDQRVFVANGGEVAVVRVVSTGLPSLMEVSCMEIYKHWSKNTIMASITVPPSLKLMLDNVIMNNTIYDPIPGNCKSLKNFLIQQVDVAYGCIYCTVKHNEKEQLYTLYIEHMGSLVPLLDARQVGHVRPKFVIYDRSAREVMAETLDLAQVHSNVWGTKFEILGTGLHKKCLAKVNYKASLIHWLPRKMTVKIPNPESKISSTNSRCHIMKQLINEDNKLMCLDNGLKMYNCVPKWNNEYRVYQLDCGGRVTVESEKNCRFDYTGVQALQFGRIADDSYTLDFGYPFSAIQAFGVALSSLTHRLK